MTSQSWAPAIARSTIVKDELALDMDRSSMGSSSGRSTSAGAGSSMAGTRRRLGLFHLSFSTPVGALTLDASRSDQ